MLPLTLALKSLSLRSNWLGPTELEVSRKAPGARSGSVYPPHQCTAGTVQRWGLPVPLRSENGPTQDPNVRFHVFINGWVGWVRGFELQVLVKMGEAPPNHKTKPANKIEVERFVFRMNTQRICCFHPGLPFDHFRQEWSPPIVACFTLVVFPFRINQ